MKQRVMQKTLSERQKQIEAQRAASRALAQKAFAIDEIAKANKAYIDAEFAAMASGDDKAKTAEKAHEKYRKTLEKYGFSKRILRANLLVRFATTRDTRAAKCVRAYGICTSKTSKRVPNRRKSKVLVRGLRP